MIDYSSFLKICDVILLEGKTRWIINISSNPRPPAAVLAGEISKMWLRLGARARALAIQLYNGDGIN